MTTFSDRYSLGKLLGQAGLGNTYACSSRAGHSYAVTLVRADHLTRYAQRRFADDRAKITSLESPYLLRVRDMLSADGVFAIVTDARTGPSLAEALSNDQLPATVLVQIAAAVAHALAALSAQGIVHRAVRPAAILLDQGSGGARLTDFGLSWLSDEEWVRPGSDADADAVAARYRAPEVGQHRRVTAAADVYSLGVLLYETLTGCLVPAGRDARRAMRAHDRSFGQLPSALRRLIMQMLDEDPGRRPDSADCAATLTALAPKMSRLAAIAPPLPRPPATNPRPVASTASRTPPPAVVPLPAVPSRAATRPKAARPSAVGIGAGSLPPNPAAIDPGSDILSNLDVQIRVAGRALWPLAIGLFTLAVTAVVILRTGSGLHTAAQVDHVTKPSTRAVSSSANQRRSSSGSGLSAGSHFTSAQPVSGKSTAEGRVGSPAPATGGIPHIAGSSSLLTATDPAFGTTPASSSASIKSPGQTTAGQIAPGQTTAGQTTATHTTPGHSTPGYPTPGHSTPGTSNSGAAATQPPANSAVQTPGIVSTTAPDTPGSDPAPGSDTAQPSPSEPVVASSPPAPSTAVSQPPVVVSTSNAPTPTPPSITSSALGAATVGVPYSAQIPATDLGSITWSIRSGSLPDGLSLDPSSGTISGTPTTTGSFDFIVEVLDELAQSSTAEFTITVNPATTT